MNHHEFFMDLQMHRGIMFEGMAKIVSRAELADILPHYWRDERVASPEEWFIRMGRGLGFHITHCIEHGDFVVRRTQDERDEATITWSNRRSGT